MQRFTKLKKKYLILKINSSEKKVIDELKKIILI